LLWDVFGATIPEFTHVPLVLSEEGGKLSKRNAATELRELRALGISAEQVIGYLMFSLGLIDSAKKISAKDALPLFDVKRIRNETFILPQNFPEILLKV